MKTFIALQNDEAIFLNFNVGSISNPCFESFTIIECDGEKALNVEDATQIADEIEQVMNLDDDFYIRKELKLKELKKKLKLLTEKIERIRQTQKVPFDSKLELLENAKMEVAQWINTFPIKKEIQEILDNEVSKIRCEDCDEWFDEEETRYIDDQTICKTLCTECALEALKQKYKL